MALCLCGSEIRLNFSLALAHINQMSPRTSVLCLPIQPFAKSTQSALVSFVPISFVDHVAPIYRGHTTNFFPTRRFLAYFKRTASGFFVGGMNPATYGRNSS